MRAKKIIKLFGASLLILLILSGCSENKDPKPIISNEVNIPVYVSLKGQLYKSTNLPLPKQKGEFMGKIGDAEFYKIPGTDPSKNVLVVINRTEMVDEPVKFDENTAIKYAIADDNIGLLLIPNLHLPDKVGTFEFNVPNHLSSSNESVKVQFKIDPPSKKGENIYDITITETWGNNKNHTWLIQSIPNQTKLIKETGDTPPQKA